MAKTSGVTITPHKNAEDLLLFLKKTQIPRVETHSWNNEVRVEDWFLNFYSRT